MQSDDRELKKICCEIGLLTDRSGELCSKCEDGKLEYKKGRHDGYAYLCSNRCCKRQVSVTANAHGLFLERVPLRKQMIVLYNMIHHNDEGADSWSFDAELDDRGTAEIVRNVQHLVSWWMIRANWLLQVGGPDEDVEADEMSFRSKKRIVDGEVRFDWYRFLGFVRRGSSLYYWGELETRTSKSKKGGGGKLGVEELQAHVLQRGSEAGFRSRCLLHPGSVLHTDTASAYVQLHRLSGHLKYSKFGFWVTQVRHSRKQNDKGQWLPVQYVVRKKVQLRSGQWVWRKGGTQKKDGFWALVRKHVSRRATTTERIDVLRHMAYFYQWLYWQSSDPIADALRGRRCGLPCTDMLTALGALRMRLLQIVGLPAMEAAGKGWYDTYKHAFLDSLPKPSVRRPRKSPE